MRITFDTEADAMQTQRRSVADVARQKPAARKQRRRLLYMK